jgi:transcriptional regulator with XRE-family HTH domain
MPKLINVAGKIKDTRKRLGMTQKEFILNVSKQLNLNSPLNVSLASQWESSLKNRANPTDAQLAAIALLTSRPWETMWWFMRDDIDHIRGFVLYPNGQFSIAPPDLSPEQEEELHTGLATNLKTSPNEPISKELIAWIKEPSEMWTLYVPLNEDRKPSNSHKKKLRDSVVNQGEICQSCEFRNHKFVKFCTQCGELMDSKRSDESGLINLIFPPKNSEDSVSIVIGDGNYSSQKNESNSLPNRTGFQVSQGLEVGDLVNFPALSISQYQSSNAGLQKDDNNEHLTNFWSAIKFFATDDHAIPIDHFNQRIQAGAISQLVNYFDGERAIQVVIIRRNLELRTLRKSLQTKMMELCFIDRMKKRTSKKLIVVSSLEKGLNLDPLTQNLGELIRSSELLGVAIQFTSGPLQVAECIAAFKTKNNISD